MQTDGDGEVDAASVHDREDKLLKFNLFACLTNHTFSAS